MNAQMPALSISAPTTSVNATSSGSKQLGQSSGSTGKDVFAGLLVSQVGTEPTSEQMDANMSVMMALSILPPTIESMQDSPIDANVAEQLVQAIQNDPALAQEITNDPNIQQWLQDAMALLQAMNTTSGSNSSQLLQSNQTLLNLSVDGGSLQTSELQQVLLQFTQLMDKQPDQPFVQHLQAQLQNVLAPYNEAIAASLNPNSQLSAAIESSTLVSGDNSQPVEKLDNKQAITASTKSDTTDGKRMVTVESTDRVKNVAKASASLELLTSKGALSAAQLVNPDSSESVHQDASIAVDDATNINVVQAGNVLKELTGTASDVAKAATPTMNAANFAEEMSRFVFKSLQVKVGEGVSEAKLSLYPQHLGHIDVKITMQNGHMMAQFAAQTAAAKELLESQLPQLRQMLQNQGLQVEKLEVALSSQFGSSMFQQQQRGQAFQQERRSGNTGDSVNNITYTTSDNELLQEIAEAKERIRERSTGGLFQASV
ncbi:flagellar hook-length control protein FliK [Paenibacillus sp. N1-5-1-14]|uniref:flagellar hook-length control protein FliK n=1 Tax=Paenibacillus radicibacter TaxID=2972488 RepID=UPI0021591052|nr:flagellar hook-length control protein FliK [Paenibacillus radicibacter]MCR8642189.1 flagellar hook-length control protein FliK [Paenibacillus radicibacter]